MESEAATRHGSVMETHAPVLFAASPLSATHFDNGDGMADPLSAFEPLEGRWNAQRMARRYSALVVPVALDGVATGSVYEGRFRELAYRWTWTFQDHNAGVEIAVNVSGEGPSMHVYKRCKRSDLLPEIDPSSVAPAVAVAWMLAMGQRFTEVPFEGDLAIVRWRLESLTGMTAWTVGLAGGEETRGIRTLEADANRGSSVADVFRRAG